MFWKEILIGGIIIGLLLSLLFTKTHIRDSNKVVIILSVSFILVAVENSLAGVVGFSGLLAVMALGATLQQRKYEVSKRINSLNYGLVRKFYFLYW
mgnify:FL=1